VEVLQVGQGAQQGLQDARAQPQLQQLSVGDDQAPQAELTNVRCC
jgi:hypothetical protein